MIPLRIGLRVDLNLFTKWNFAGYCVANISPLGWDEGVMEMTLGEKSTLTISP